MVTMTEGHSVTCIHVVGCGSAGSPDFPKQGQGAVMLGRAAVAHRAPVVWRGMGHSARAQGGQPQSFLAHLLRGVNDLSLLTSVLLAPGSGEHQPRELLCHEM